MDHSKIVAPLTLLLKNNHKWSWSPECQRAFQELKDAVMRKLVLAMLNMSKSFEVHTNASDFALGGVLLQEGHPMAYKIRKLNEAERRYIASEELPLHIVCAHVNTICWGPSLW